MKKALGLLLCISVLWGSAQSVFAQDALPSNAPAQDIPPAVREQLERKSRYENAIQRLERHLTVGPDGLLHLDVDRSPDIGVPGNIIDELQTGMQAVNDQVRAGAIGIEDVLLSSGRSVSDPEAPRPPVVVSATPGDVPQQAVACAGWTGIRWFWYGPRLYLNECHTQTLQSVLETGPDVSVLCAALSNGTSADIPVGIACGFAAGLVDISARALHAIDSWGGNQGVYFQLTWLNRVGWRVNWMWHQ